MSDSEPLARHLNHDIWPGTLLYDRAGNQYEFGALMDEGRWYVHPMLEQMGWDGESETYASPVAVLKCITDLFPEPPKPVLAQEIAKAEERLRAIRQEIRDADREFANFKYEEKDRQERLRRHAELARLDDWIQGKITHVVQTQSSEIRIKAIEDFHEDRRYMNRGECVIKLLTLFGATNGNLNWKFGSHRDDSGHQWDVIPCSSHEEALETVSQMVDEMIAAWRASGMTAPTTGLFLAEKTTKQFDLPFPDDAIEAIRLARIASHQQSVDKAREQFASAVAKLDEVRNG